jgi:hypothetical protein
MDTFTTVTRFNVERASSGTALYLAYDADLRETFWTGNPDLVEPTEYETEDEAQDAADEHGGEVFKFERLTRRTDQESFTGHNAAARLERTLQEAAE